MSMEIPGIGSNGTIPDIPPSSGSHRHPSVPRPVIDGKPTDFIDGNKRRNEYEKLLEKLINTVAPYDQRLKYSINHKLGEVVVKVIDTRTDKVIKEIPPADIQKLQERIREAVGLLIDRKI